MLRKGLPVLLVLLLVANALLAAAVLGVFGPEPLGGWWESQREPHRVSQQVRGERMRLQPAPTGASAPAAAPGAQPASAPLAAAGRCLELGGFSAQAIERAANDLADSAWHVERFERQEQVRWWIHLPPQPTRENADRKLAELRRRHVTDFSVIAAGTPEAYTVSLGLFRERERAERYLETLRGQGVRTAVLSDAPRPLTRQWLRVRDFDAAARGRLEEMRRQYGAEDLIACGA